MVYLEMISGYCIPFLLGLGLLAFTFVDNVFPRRVTRLFVWSLSIVLLLCVADAGDVLFKELFDTYVFGRVITSAIGYTLRPATVMLLLLIMLRDRIKTKWIVFVPELVNMLVVWSALFTDACFSFSETNEFQRGPLGFVPFVVGGVYIVAVAVALFVTRRQKVLYETAVLLFIVLLSGVAVFVSSLTAQDYILVFGVIGAYCFLYMFLHTTSNSIDALTGAFIRRKFYVDAKNYDADITAVMSIDLNGLKQLNDLQGHAEGDKALVAVAVSVTEALTHGMNLYRTGGDEFMVLCHRQSESAVQNVIRNIGVNMSRTSYACAVGYCMREAGMTVVQMSAVADERMYADKRMYKKEHLD